MKVSNLLLSIFAVLVSFMTIPANASDWRLQSAFFYIESYKAVCADCGTHYRKGNYYKNSGLMLRVSDANVDIDYKNRYLMTGRIEINQLDLDTFATRKLVIGGVKLKMEATGIILDLSYGGNTRMRIKGLEGHQVKDIFEGTYSGGKARMSVAFLQLSLMIAKNPNGITIIDNQDLITLGVNYDAYHVNLNFSLNDIKNEIVVYNSEGEVTTTNSDVGKKILGVRIN